MRQSYDIRATIANLSYTPIRCDRNVIMVAMSYFCRQNVSQISLEIVVNCSHLSEILALLLADETARLSGIESGSLFCFTCCLHRYTFIYFCLRFDFVNYSCCFIQDLICLLVEC